MSDKMAILEAVCIFGKNKAKFVALTLKDADTFYQEIQDSLRDRDFDALALSAHSLKSIMSQAGANEVAHIAYDLEKLGKIKECPSVNIVERFTEAYVEAKTILLAVADTEA
jgi:HPt (histidine-containing phosphotransfer) domain-containing protein